MLTPKEISSGRRDVYPLDLAHSLYTDGVDDDLRRTPAIATNQKTFTFSDAVKRFKPGDFHTIFGAGADVDGRTHISFYDDDTLRFSHVSAGATTAQFTSDAKFIDSTNHYHIVVVVDTTEAVSDDRVKIWVNGVRLTGAWTGSLTQDQNVFINGAYFHSFSRTPYLSTGMMEGLHSSPILVDGIALEPTAFGKFSGKVTGLWVPKKYTGTYGTNGFHLDFADAANLGNDVSGNDNDFTVSGSPTQTVDTPTNNHATLNLHGNTFPSANQPTLTEGNLHVAWGTSTYGRAVSTFPLPNTGKWLWEYKSDAISSNIAEGVGIGGVDNTYDRVLYFDGGIIRVGETTVQSGLAHINAGDVLTMLVDADAQTITFYMNGVQQGVPQSYATYSHYMLFPYVMDTSSSSYITSGKFFFGSQGFNHVPDDEYKALCADNLPDNEYDLSGSYIGNGQASDGPFENANCTLESVTIDGTTYDNDGSASAVVQFFANGFKLVSTTNNANGTTYNWTGVLRYPSKYSNAQSN